MILRSLLTAGLLLVLAAPAAHAGRIETRWGGNQLTLAGERTAWSAIEFQRSLSIESAPPNGPVTRLWSVPDDLGTSCDRVLDLEGSATRVAAIYIRPGGEYCPDREVLAGPVDGPLARLELPAPERDCGAGPTAIALDGDDLAVGLCGGRIAIYDLAAGGPPRILRPKDQFSAGSEMHMTGGRIGFVLPGDLFQRGGVLVIDATTGEKVMRVDAHDLSIHRLQLGADGRAVFTADAAQNKGYVLYVATPQDPVPRPVPVPLCSPHFGYDGGDLVFVCRRDAADRAVIDLAGDLKGVVAGRAALPGWADFDGRRIAWTYGDSHTGYIQNEAWPYTPPKPPAPDRLGGGSGRQRALSSNGAAAVELAASGRRVLAVWLAGGRSIVSRLVNLAGAPVGSSRVVSGPAPPGSLVVQPAVAAGPRGRWLVAWTGAGAGDADASVRTRLVSARGRPAGAERALPQAAAETFATTPAVVAVRGGYLVAWTSDRRDGGGRVLVARMDATGRPQGEPQVVHDRPSGSSGGGLDLVATGDDRALVVWSHGQPGARPAIHAQYLDASGRSAGERMRLSEAGAARADSVMVAHHRAAKRTLVVWREGDVPFTGDVRTAVVRPGRAGAARTLRGVGPDFRMAAEAVGRGFLVAGVRTGHLGDREVYAVRTGLDGRSRGKAFRVSRMGPDRTVPRDDGRAEDGSLPALVRTGRGRVLAGWQGSDDGRRARIWVRALRVR